MNDDVWAQGESSRYPNKEICIMPLAKHMQGKNKNSYKEKGAV